MRHLSSRPLSSPSASSAKLPTTPIRPRLPCVWLSLPTDTRHYHPLQLEMNMTVNRPFLGRVASCVAFVSAFSAHPVIAQEARLDRDCTPHLTQMQQRLFQKAEEGPDALRNFIFIRRAIVQVDTYGTAVWA